MNKRKPIKVSLIQAVIIIEVMLFIIMAMSYFLFNAVERRIENNKEEIITRTEEMNLKNEDKKLETRYKK